MEFYEKEFLLSRIKSGCLIFEDSIFIKRPDYLTEYRANLIYKKSIKEAEEFGLLSDNQILLKMIAEDMWSEEKDEQLEVVIPKHIEYWKIKIFETALRTEEQKKMRAYLKAVNEEFHNLFNQRYAYSYASVQGYAKYCKNLYLIANSSYYENGEKIDCNQVNINTLLSYYNNSVLNEKQLRELARTNPWQDEWHALKKNGRIFDSNNLTYEQKALIIWSSLYSNIHESMDCPSEDIINDDDALDGWLISQRKKRERDSNKRSLESSLSSKVKNAGEVFVITDARDAFKIADLNDPAAQAIRRSRWSQLMKEGQVKEQSFVDSKQEQNTLATQAYRGKMKGK